MSGKDNLHIERGVNYIILDNVQTSTKRQASQENGDKCSVNSLVITARSPALEDCKLFTSYHSRVPTGEKIAHPEFLSAAIRKKTKDIRASQDKFTRGKLWALQCPKKRGGRWPWQRRALAGRVDPSEPQTCRCLR